MALSAALEYPRRLYISIALATSPDGLKFTSHKAGAVIKPDIGNPLEDFCCSKPAVYMDRGWLRMWYNTAGLTYRVCYAERDDGIKFELDPRVVIDAT